MLDQIIISVISWLDLFVDLAWLLSDGSRNIIEFISLLIGFLLPALLSWTVYFKRLEYHDREGWKKHFPQFDISGEWQDQTVYTNMIDNNQWVSTDKMAEKLKEKGWSSENLPAIPSSVIIMQTCRKIKIDVSNGAGFTWRSLSAEWSDDSLKILYEVTYNEVLRNKGYPQQRYGYEKMHIDKNGLTQKDKPKKMTEQFWHCIAGDSKAIFMGDIKHPITKSKTTNVSWPVFYIQKVINWGVGGFIGAKVALMVMDLLYADGTFKPLTEEERVSSNLIMFSDVLPKE